MIEKQNKLIIIYHYKHLRLLSNRKKEKEYFWIVCYKNKAKEKTCLKQPNNIWKGNNELIGIAFIAFITWAIT